MSKISIEAMIELYHKHDGNHYRVARELGCTREWVRQKLSPIGLTAKGRVPTHKPNKGPIKYTETYLRELYEKCDGRIYKMAKLANVVPSVISSAIKRIGLEDELAPKTNLGRPRRKSHENIQ